jgi:hypothetical protein
MPFHRENEDISRRERYWEVRLALAGMTRHRVDGESGRIDEKSGEKPFRHSKFGHLIDRKEKNAFLAGGKYCMIGVVGYKHSNPFTFPTVGRHYNGDS